MRRRRERLPWPSALAFVGCAVVLAAVAFDAGHGAHGTAPPDARSGSPERSARAGFASRSRNASTSRGPHAFEPGTSSAWDDPTALAPSLRDTRIDGGFTLDARGRVVFDAGLVRLFDYLRGTIGEATEDEIRAFLALLARERLSEEEVARVLALYDRYVATGEEAAERMREVPGLYDDPEAALEAMHAIRVEEFGEVDAERAFGEQERIARGVLRKSEVDADRTLSREEREARLAELEADVPERIATLWRAMRVPGRLREETASMVASGATAAEVHAMRVQEVGPEAADRLAALDEARRVWDERVAAYRDELATRYGADPSEADLAALRSEHFAGPELLRIASLDRLDLGIDE